LNFRYVLLLLKCILLSEKPILFVTQSYYNPIKDLKICVSDVIVIWRKMKGNYDLLRFSGNWEQNTRLWEYEEEFLTKIVISLLQLFILEIDCIYILLYLKLEASHVSNLIYCPLNEVVLIIKSWYGLSRFIYFAWGQVRF